MQVIILQAERDAFDQTCQDLSAELGTTRHQISTLENEIMITNNTVVSGIDQKDTDIRGALKYASEGLKAVSDFNKVAQLSYSLDVAKSTTKAQEHTIKMLRMENEALKKENKMLRSNFEHSRRNN
jgi:predicted  nucleic acid-binding Zn-ribbon protein